MKALPEAAHARPGYADWIYPLPVKTFAKESRLLTCIHEALSVATTAMIRGYWHDSTLQELVPVPKQVRRCLKAISDLPYGSDLLRPDFVFDKNSGKPMLCEINCRFPLNGFLMSMLLDRTVNPDYYAATSSSDLDLIEQRLGQMTGGRLSIIKGRERGFDIHLLRAGNPNALIVTKEEFLARKPAAKKILLELHQDELAETLEPIVRHMLRGGTVINDPRTVLILHNKRMLCALSNPELLRRYLPDPALAAILREHVIPTHCPELEPAVLREARRHKDCWVAKRAISGKSDGIWIGISTSSREWQEALQQSDIVLQPFIGQAAHKFYDPCCAGQPPLSANLVATTLSIQNGPSDLGMYRMFKENSAAFLAFSAPKRD